MQGIQEGETDKETEANKEDRKMTAKEYLTKICIYRRQLDGIQMEIDRLYEEAAGVKAIVYDKDRVQTSPQNRLEEMMERVDAECEKWGRMRVRYEREVRKRVDQISKLGNPDYSELLMLRYVDLKEDGRQRSLEEIAYRMSKSYQRIRHMHGEALEAFRRKYL